MISQRDSLQFGGNEQLLTWDTTIFDGLTYFFFITVYDNVLKHDISMDNMG